MLISLSVSNHRSFHDTQSLTLYRETRGVGDAREAGWKRPDVLPVTAIYGANAAGKSALVSALGFLRSAVEGSYREWSVEGGVPRMPFLLDHESASRPTEFDVEFIAADGNEYRFGFAVDDDRVLSEYLHVYKTRRKTVLYERDGDDWYFGDSFRGPASQIRDITRPNALFISAAAAAQSAVVREPYRWIVSRLSVYSATGYMSEHRRVTRQLKTDADFREQMLRILQGSDIGVTDIEVTRKELEQEDLDRYQRYFGKEDSNFEAFIEDVESHLELTHRGRGVETSLPEDYESAGTHALISFASVALAALKRGATCVVDEIDSSLHPLLVAELVRVFASPRTNPNQAQLIFTTHDVSLLRPAPEGQAVLSRDEIWVVEKDRHGESALVALSEYGPRTSDNLERGYLTGRFGGLPTLSIANNWLAVEN